MSSSGFRASAIAGAGVGGTSAFALFSAVDIASIIKHEESYITMLYGFGVLAAIALCTQLLGGRIQNQFAAAGTSKPSIITYVLSAVVLCCVGVLGWRAATDKTPISGTTVGAASITETIVEYKEHFPKPFSRDFAKFPTDLVTLTPQLNSKPFQNGSITFKVGDANESVLLQIENLQDLEHAYTSLETDFTNLQRLRTGIQQNCQFNVIPVPHRFTFTLRSENSEPCAQVLAGITRYFNLGDFAEAKVYFALAARAGNPTGQAGLDRIKRLESL